MTTATDTRRSRIGNLAEGMEIPRSERNSCRSLWSPARDTLKGMPGTRAGELTHCLLVNVTILAAGYWTIRVLQGVM